MSGTVRSLLESGLGGIKLRRNEPTYSADEVLAAFRDDLSKPDHSAIRKQVELLGTYIDDGRLVRRFRGIDAYRGRLATILTDYLRGASPDAIAERYRPVLTAVGVERALYILAGFIAERLNEQAGR